MNETISLSFVALLVATIPAFMFWPMIAKALVGQIVIKSEKNPAEFEPGEIIVGTVLFNPRRSGVIESAKLNLVCDYHGRMDKGRERNQVYLGEFTLDGEGKTVSAGDTLAFQFSFKAPVNVEYTYYGVELGRLSKTLSKIYDKGKYRPGVSFTWELAAQITLSGVMAYHSLFISVNVVPKGRSFMNEK